MYQALEFNIEKKNLARRTLRVGVANEYPKLILWGSATGNKNSDYSSLPVWKRTRLYPSCESLQKRGFMPSLSFRTDVAYSERLQHV